MTVEHQFNCTKYGSFNAFVIRNFSTREKDENETKNRIEGAKETRSILQTLCTVVLFMKRKGSSGIFRTIWFCLGVIWSRCTNGTLEQCAQAMRLWIQIYQLKWMCFALLEFDFFLVEFYWNSSMKIFVYIFFILDFRFHSIFFPPKISQDKNNLVFLFVTSRWEI